MLASGKGRFAVTTALLMVTAAFAGCATPQQEQLSEESACLDAESSGDMETQGAQADGETNPAPSIVDVPEAELLQQPGGGPIKIGTLLPLTGELEAFGPDMQAAVELAAEDINNAGGVMGREIQVVQGDSQTDSSQAPQEFNRLVAQNVTAVVGAASSGVTNSVLEQAVDNDVVLITPASTSPALTNRDNNQLFFRVPPNDLLQGKVMASLLEEDGVDSASTLYVNNDYGQGLSDQFASEFDGEIVNEVSFDSDATQFSSEVTEVSNGNPDAIVAVMYPKNGVPLMQEAFTQGLTSETEFYFSEGVFSGDFVDPLGTTEEGNSIVAGCKGTTPEVLLDTGPESFQQRFNKSEGHPPGLFAAQSYDAAIAVALGMSYSQSTDPNDFKKGMQKVWNSPGKKTSNVTEALALAQAGQNIDWQGPSGDFDWNDKHDPERGVYGIWQVTEEGDLDVLERGIEVELD